jgi:integrase
MPTHSILGGKVKLYRRNDGGESWFCSTYFQGKNRRKSTKTDSLPHAEEIAEGWYLELRGKGRAGLLGPTGKPFNSAADAFMEEYEASTQGERSDRWVTEHAGHIKNHLKPFFGKYALPEIDADMVQEYRIARGKQHTRRGGSAESRKKPPGPDEEKKFPARNTIENEVITLRMIMKTAERKGWIKAIPNLSAPYKKQKKVEHRPWFSLDEYKRLYTATRDYAKNVKRVEDRWYADQLHDLVLFLGNTGLRPDEAKNLEHRDVAMVKDDDTGELILEIDVRGKTGFGYCKSRPDAVKPYQRLLNRPKWTPQGRAPRSKKAIAAAKAAEPHPVELPKPTDKVFPGSHLKLFNKILKQKGVELKFDRDGNAHTLYSLRHFYICQRLTEGADIYQLAKNCRTSVEMIQKYYAAHIKHIIDAAAINTKRPRKRQPAPLLKKAEPRPSSET